MLGLLCFCFEGGREMGVMEMGTRDGERRERGVMKRFVAFLVGKDVCVCVCG